MATRGCSISNRRIHGIKYLTSSLDDLFVSSCPNFNELVAPNKEQRSNFQSFSFCGHQRNKSLQQHGTPDGIYLQRLPSLLCAWKRDFNSDLSHHGDRPQWRDCHRSPRRDSNRIGKLSKLGSSSVTYVTVSNLALHEYSIE